MLILHLRINAVYILSTGTLQLWLLSGRTGIFPFRGGVTGIINIFGLCAWMFDMGCFFVFVAYMFFFLCIKRHIYTRLVERNVSPSHAELLVFLMSAALCEVQSTLLASLERNYQCFLTSFGTGYIAPLLMAVSDSYLTGLQYHIWGARGPSLQL